MAWAVVVNGEIVAVASDHKDALALCNGYQTTDKKTAQVKSYPS